ncbi:MAG: DUF4330 family protein [Clostridia bacterium]|nr:DUF4330 family protein [Clostridia bacterium]MBQ4574920.1 DUF4330 family protein [Clostridia bacterium]
MENAKKARFNVIDLLIILAFIAIAAGILLRYNIADKLGVRADSVEVEMTFRVSDMRATSQDFFTVGDIFVWDSIDVTLGELTEIEFKSAEAIVEKVDGSAMLTYSDTRIDAIGTIRAKGIMTDEGFMLEGTQFISPGKDVPMKNGKIYVIAVIEEMKVIG